MNDTDRSVVVEHAARDLVRTLNLLNHSSNKTLTTSDLGPVMARSGVEAPAQRFSLCLARGAELQWSDGCQFSRGVKDSLTDPFWSAVVNSELMGCTVRRYSTV